MKKIFKIVPFIIVAVLVGVTAVYAGSSLTPPGSPTKTMKSLSDLYTLIDTGVETGSFSTFDTPSTIGTTMNSLGDSYNRLKTQIASVDTAKANILSGTTLFGIGGTMPDRGAVTVTPGISDQTIAQGYHNGEGLVSGDADLVDSNILGGVDIFGISGTLNPNPDYGDNDPNKVLNTASNPGNYDPNSCSVNYDTEDLSVGTVKSGTSFGNSLTGDYPSVTYPLPGNTDTNAIDSNILTGYEAWNKAGTHISGSMIDQAAKSYTPSNIVQTITAGYYNGSGSVSTDANLIESNIKSGVSIFGVSGNLSAGTNYSLPKTDQTVCWSYTGSSISCAGTGQDGDLRKGFEGTRFTNNGDGTTTDNATGLIWQRQDNNTKYLWSAALAYCNNTTGLPGSGWRTPNIKELMSIANYQNASPAIDTTNFINTKSLQYWSNTTTLPAVVGLAWTLNFNDGSVSNTDKGMFPQYVRCVR